MGNVEKSCLHLRDFSKRPWESALYADFPGSGIFHQAGSKSLIQSPHSSAEGILTDLFHSVLRYRAGHMAPFHNAYNAARIEAQAF